MATIPVEQKCRRVEQYLLDRTTDGPVFVKSKFIADDVDLSAREIGTALGRLDTISGELSVEKWSYTNATTWRVERV